MSITSEISRLQTARNTIRAKMVELGRATNTDTLDVLANSVNGIKNVGAVHIQVKEGETGSIPEGYHNGSGTIAGIGGGGNYELQDKIVTPTKNQQPITSDDGYYGLSSVTVRPIPEAYQDVSAVTAEKAHVLTGKVFVTATGVVETGEMLNNGAVSRTIDGLTTTSVTIEAGYHNGSGTVSLTNDIETALAAI